MIMFAELRLIGAWTSQRSQNKHHQFCNPCDIKYSTSVHPCPRNVREYSITVPTRYCPEPSFCKPFWDNPTPKSMNDCSYNGWCWTPSSSGSSFPFLFIHEYIQHNYIQFLPDHTSSSHNPVNQTQPEPFNYGYSNVWTPQQYFNTLVLGDAPLRPTFPPIFFRYLCIFLLIITSPTQSALAAPIPESDGHMT